MPRNYVKKREDPKYTKEDVRSAILEVKAGEKCGKVAKKYSIPRSTLQKKAKNYIKDESNNIRIKKGTKPIFSEIQEQILVDIFRLYELHLLSFTTFEVRKIAFELAVRLHLKHSFSMDTELAGKEAEGFFGSTQRFVIKKT